MSAIFLSYRRDDSSGYAGRLFDNLAERFGRERLFMDIETLEPGMDFVTGIDRAIESCGAVIAIIGPNWVRAQDSEGRRRLDNPHDFIRLEITSALTRGVRIIPVLVHHATMPPEHELPEPLHPLCRLQAYEISDNRWEFDVSRLADVLEPLIAEPEGNQTTEPLDATDSAGAASTTTVPGQDSGGVPTNRLAVAAALVLAVGGATWWLTQSSPSREQSPIPVSEPKPSSPAPTGPTEPVVPAVALPEPPTEPSPTKSARVEPPAPGDPWPGISPETQATPEAEPAVVPAPRGPSPEELREREIAELIHAAEIDLSELRLTRPAGNNAFERFHRVLELAPDNLTAREGLAAITERYHGLVGEALARSALDTAQRHLDSARAVDPGADWLTPMQREIEQRRHDENRTGHQPERVQRPGATNREACVSACENRHQTCLAGIDHDTEAVCLQRSAENCEERYQSCMSDFSQLYMGQVALESKCAGVHIICSKTAAEECAAAPQIARTRCDTQFEDCARRCQSAQ